PIPSLACRSLNSKTCSSPTPRARGGAVRALGSNTARALQGRPALLSLDVGSRRGQDAVSGHRGAPVANRRGRSPNRTTSAACSTHVLGELSERATYVCRCPDSA